ncbi:hypothetical protein [Wenzhouxiangella sp. XN24]|uniref:hypothetical protein n=1 Tax=Wenzhouxiangella sp. XN24 TaxID=2713569 RepID=UPI0013EA788E|nr:hypothetical protein [Wenzhouxiangella sp. XN24]NGX14797.1 hypothetical protein [Wenzhouxiangella sp. XN24]
MDYVTESLAILGAGLLLGLVLAWLNNRLLMPRENAESMRTLAYVFFVVLGLALAGLAGVERAYKGLFDDMTERIRPTVHAGMHAAGLDPGRVPVGEVGRMLEVMDQALHREVARQDAEWFLELLEGHEFGAWLENTRLLGRAMQSAGTIDVEQAFLTARDVSFSYFFPWAQRAFWAVLALFPFFALLLRASA